MTQPSDILIVGAGQAGGCAAAALRREGYAGRILLAGAEAHRPYERPPLSKAVLESAANDDGIYLHKADYHDGLGLDWHPNATVAQIDAANRIALMADGKKLSFDRCLIATGGRARALPGLPADAPNVFTLRGLDDARRLRERLAPGASVTVLGGGFLGLEFAGMARQKGLSVTVLEAGPQILGRAVPPLVAAWLAGRHGAAGTEIVCNARLRGVDAGAGGVTATLEDGRVFRSDFLLVSIGQEPNVELAAAAGIALDNGIAVDARCQTSAPDVYSAGDCASHYSNFLGKRVRLESWQNAQEQAQVAAKAMLGLPAGYDVVPWFWSDQLGMNIQMLGMPEPDYRYLVRGDTSGEKFCVFGFGGESLRYALAVNSGGDIRPLRNLLESGAHLPPDALLDAGRPIREIVKKALA